MPDFSRFFEAPRLARLIEIFSRKSEQAPKIVMPEESLTTLSEKVEALEKGLGLKKER